MTARIHPLPRPIPALTERELCERVQAALLAPLTLQAPAPCSGRWVSAAEVIREEMDTPATRDAVAVLLAEAAKGVDVQTLAQLLLSNVAAGFASWQVVAGEVA